MRVPSSTPGGMVTSRDFSLRVRPEPRQLGHGSEMTWPAPWHMGQVRSTVKKPCWLRTFPAPRQVGQFVGAAPFLPPEPLHGSQVIDDGTVILAFLPWKASSRVISML